MTSSHKKSVAIIGGGAAGIFCAIHIAQFNEHIQIYVLEKSNKLLQKVKVSGGGRCNVTNACLQLSNLVNHYPRGKVFLKKSLKLFSPSDTMEWFETRGVALKIEDDKRAFPQSDNAQSVINCLMQYINSKQTQILMQQDVKSIVKQQEKFIINTTKDMQYKVDAVMVACGGYAKWSQYEWIRNIGHHIIAPVPSLFTFNIHQKKLHALMGLSVNTGIVKIIGTTFEEKGPILITHWGLSGPAVIKLSAWAAPLLAEKEYQFSIAVNWIGIKENELRSQWNDIRNGMGGNVLFQKNPFALPQRLWEYVLTEIGVDSNTKWSELTAGIQNKLISTLCAHTMMVSGKTTYKEEFVTAGGVDTLEVNPETMESKIVKGLYFGGEIMNVDGITGGFNFQHAWSSGYLAGKAIASTL